MDCLTCGKENPEKATVCVHCGEDLVKGQAPFPPKAFSWMAISSSALATLAFAFGFLKFAVPLTAAALAGLGLGILALRRIRRSRGALRGTVFAIAGTTLSGLLLAFIACIFFVLVLPSWRSDRVFALRARCKNNLKTIGLALHLYASDHGGDFPPGESGLQVFSQLVGEGYLSDAEIFVCPASTPEVEAWRRIGKLSEETCSYAYVPWLSESSPPDLILAYEKAPGNHDFPETPPGRHVLFVGVYVRWMREETFHRAMAEQLQTMSSET